MQPNGNVPGTTGRPVAGVPVNNVNVKSAPVPTPPPTPKPAEPTFGNGGSVVEGKDGKKTGWILAIVFLLIVAAGGVGFGVWAMMDGNVQKDALNEQISALKQQNNELQNKLDGGTVVDIEGGYKNPVITSPNSETEYFVNYESSPMDYNMESEKRLNISLTNGEVSICRVITKGEMIDCKINGISGKVYKIVELGSGQTNSNSKVAFIMEDGTVKYMPLISSLENNNFTISGDLNVDGEVVDIFDISAGPSVNDEEAAGGGGYMTSVIVFNDGTFATYDESMLNQ